MQRDEGPLIDAWCRYHGHLFGFESLTILDNGSIRSETVEILRRYQRVGSAVMWQYRSDADYANRHAHFDALAKRDGQPEGLAIGLDCDEWLALFAGDGLTCDRDALLAYFDRTTWTRPGAFEIGGALLNVPTMGGFFWGVPTSRRFISVGSAVEPDVAVQATDLVVVRSCNRPLSLPDDAAKGRQAANVQVVGAAGAMTPAQCRRFFSGKLLVDFLALGRLAEAIGIGEDVLARPVGDSTGPSAPSRVLMPDRSDRARAAVEFDAASYLQFNPDVAMAGWPALEHFVRHGFIEGRRW